MHREGEYSHESGVRNLMPRTSMWLEADDCMIATSSVPCYCEDESGNKRGCHEMRLFFEVQVDCMRR